MTSGTGSMCILYVDPDEATAIDVARQLGGIGHDVTHVAHGTAIVAHLADRAFDAVLLADSEGEEALQAALHSLDGAEDVPPVVCLLASQSAPLALGALEAGAQDYLVRQDDPSFANLLEAVLARSIAYDRAQREKLIAEQEAAASRSRSEVLLNEMKHRIANSLALIVSMAHMQAGALPRGEAHRAMDDFASRVHAIAQVHKGLYASMKIGTVAVDDYLTRLARELRSEHVGRRSLADVKFDCIEATVSVDQAISLGVILSELVGNAARFAYRDSVKGEVRASLRREGDGDGEGEVAAILLVEDDGVGIADIGMKNAGLGSQIVGVLAHSLGGRFQLEPKSKGVRAVLRFPLPQKGGANVPGAAS
ncbi:hypothetical protein CD351_07545 [Erythrobacter sp. KY5]|uniref:sensor histidine kinase n=1 Tax=Erythrobacter sp. KY5 TaxID=2011159 RepID=UPI000DBF0254|nr:histidine kinase dimerization/phosphoacceptor domain -containing protein [Erythrobacter sp. KY5]AWW74280.1 hypothetical protein CD351_07545 [Erythrobacter sp. KY5]